MPTNSMISIRPDYELATRYGAAWQSQIVNATNMPVIDLYGSEATAENFFSNLESQDPLIVNIFGHGNYNIIVCQNDETLFQGGVNTNVLANRIVFDLSCRAGKTLADYAISEGCISFLGYDEDFTFAITEGTHPDSGMLNPLLDEAARGFFESHNSAPISYFQTGDLNNSYPTSQDTFNYWIEVWDAIDTQVSALLMVDRDRQVMKLSGVTPPPIPIQTQGLGPLLLAFAPLALIPMMKKFK